MIGLLLKKFDVFPIEENLYITSDKETKLYKAKIALRKFKNQLEYLIERMIITWG